MVLASIQLMTLRHCNWMVVAGCLSAHTQKAWTELKHLNSHFLEPREPHHLGLFHCQLQRRRTGLWKPAMYTPQSPQCILSSLGSRSCQTSLRCLCKFHLYMTICASADISEHKLCAFNVRQTVALRIASFFLQITITPMSQFSQHDDSSN